MASNTLSLNKKAPAAAPAAAAKAPNTGTKWENEDKKKREDEYNKTLGDMSDSILLQALLYTGPLEKTTRQKGEGKNNVVTIHKPKWFLGAKLKFLKDFKVPVIRLDPSRCDRSHPYYVPKREDIQIRPVKAGESVYLNQMELAVLMVDHQVNSRIVTEKTFKGYEKIARPGFKNKPDQNRGPVVEMREDVIATFKNTRSAEGVMVPRLIMTFGSHTYDASIYYRNSEHCIDVLDPTGQQPSAPQFGGFTVYRSSNITSGGHRSDGKAVKINKGAKQFLAAMNG